mgnify:CR=1 FL=1
MRLKTEAGIKTRKGQSWSIDFVIAIVIFAGALIFFYSMLNPRSNVKVEELQRDASAVARQTSEEKLPLTILDKDTVNETKLDSLIQRDYNSIKKEMGIKNEFCIHFEDESGNIIPIRENVVGVGSPDIKVGGVRCT